MVIHLLLHQVVHVRIRLLKRIFTFRLARMDIFASSVATLPPLHQVAHVLVVLTRGMNISPKRPGTIFVNFVVTPHHQLLAVLAPKALTKDTSTCNRERRSQQHLWHVLDSLLPKQRTKIVL